MRDESRYEIRRWGGFVEIARECVAGDCNILVWPAENNRNLCQKHAQMALAASIAFDIEEQLLRAHSAITGRLFSSYEQRERFKRAVLIPALISGKRKGDGWNVQKLLAVRLDLP